MEFEKASSPNGFCIFCEDVRQEVNGKQSFIGVFVGNELNVLGILPTSIGKFSIIATFRQRRTDGLDPITFEVHVPGDDPDKPSARIEGQTENLVAKLPPPPADNDDPFISIAVGFQFNPLFALAFAGLLIGHQGGAANENPRRF
jgi:hypothetical protein